MTKFLRNLFLLFTLCAPALVAQDYNLPATIQEGTILHCFDWPVADVRKALPDIAAAGFGAVQISPVQRPDARSGEYWHALYRPYDLAFKSSSYCSENDLRGLCTDAHALGIKVIVDVVANHVDKTAGYHDTWWDSNGRVRFNG
ncbi:MAG: alpha-amylase family glycosyl hydrolase, partial [Muribaculaceae bacterium]